MIKHYNLLNTLCVTYFLTSITMTDLQSDDMCQINSNQIKSNSILLWAQK